MKDEIKEMKKEIEEYKEIEKSLIKEINKLTAESTEWESKFYDMQDNFHNANEEIKRLSKEVDMWNGLYNIEFDKARKYKSRCEKAIEYILKLDKDYDINVYQEDKHWAMVLYILQGEGK